MLYKMRRSVPKNTTWSDPDWQKLKIARGTIVQWIPFCPEECADLMEFTVSFHGHQIFPVNDDEAAGELFIPIGIDEELVIDQPPFILDFNAVNADDSYDHEYILYVNIMPPAAVAATSAGMLGWLDRFREKLGGL